MITENQTTNPLIENTSKMMKTIILGVGNELMSDEGIGVHVVRKLMNMQLPDGVEAIEGGTDGFGLLNLITEADRMIVIDTLKGGSKPGTIYKFDIEDAPSTPDMFKTSIHQIGILEVIHLSGLIGKTPATTVIGVEPATLSMGMELTDDLRRKIPKVIEIVMDTVSTDKITYPPTNISHDRAPVSCLIRHSAVRGRAIQRPVEQLRDPRFSS